MEAIVQALGQGKRVNCFSLFNASAVARRSRKRRVPHTPDTVEELPPRITVRIKPKQYLTDAIEELDVFDFAEKHGWYKDHRTEKKKRAIENKKRRDMEQKRREIQEKLTRGSFEESD